MDVYCFLFKEFETLDVFGPAEAFGKIATCHLHFISAQGGIVKSAQNVEVMTEKVDIKKFMEVVLLPGGQGTRPISNDSRTIELMKAIAQRTKYFLTVCTGAVVLAKTGLLDGRKATSNKRAFAWALRERTSVNWQKRARWVIDGKFYTSSGISAGIDMALGFIADNFGRKTAEDIAKQMEYIWNADKDNDPFAIC